MASWRGPSAVTSPALCQERAANPRRRQAPLPPFRVQEGPQRLFSHRRLKVQVSGAHQLRGAEAITGVSSGWAHSSRLRDHMSSA